MTEDAAVAALDDLVDKVSAGLRGLRGFREDLLRECWALRGSVGKLRRQVERLDSIPGLLSGVARSVDLGVTYSDHGDRFILPPEAVDALATRSDWLAVGSDLRAAMGEPKK